MTESNSRQGPLTGVKVLEMGGIGPSPFAAMMLADMGADVVRIDRPNAAIAEQGATVRGRTRIEVDLKSEEERQPIRELATSADVLIEGYRPGVMERLGLGPDVLLKANPCLVYGRMTGWGQTGPLAERAGHDINFIAITGVLNAIGTQEHGPVAPLNLVGDYGGGSLYLVTGILAAYIEVQRSGRGQVVDAAICDGVASLSSLFHRLQQMDQWSVKREANLLDGGAPHYRTYQCKDGRFLAVGALEPQFYAELKRIAGWEEPVFTNPMATRRWSEMRNEAEKIMRTRNLAEWVSAFEGSDACIAPVLTFEESRKDPHMVARECFVEVDGEVQPAPAPRFSATPSKARQSTNAESIAALIEAWRPK